MRKSSSIKVDQCAAKGVKYLFIDEIQNVDGFEEVNSYLLSGELVTKLTGRYLEFEMFPLTFDEYIGFKQFKKLPVNSDVTAEMDAYILDGGGPKDSGLCKYRRQEEVCAGRRFRNLREGYPQTGKDPYGFGIQCGPDLYHQ